ncbi:hypothetical protein RhiirA5_369472 [Rhizophagus irregularis]|uniref:Uncharacterized protein n=1 Tax=Rhizophagus irregularis TaxID=588596 RepID=A0A2N0QCU1_9GLOM|nr:hypothetical protein RhiirA5_369472 [Rhizophagus irregularis]
MDQRELLKFLKDRDDIHLSSHEWNGIFSNQHISGRAFLNLTKLDFLSIRLPLGPAVELADFVEELRENHFKTFSSRNILGELLRKYKLDGNSLEAIPLFKLGFRVLGLCYSGQQTKPNSQENALNHLARISCILNPSNVEVCEGAKPIGA